MQLQRMLTLLVGSLMVAALAGCAEESQPVVDISADEDVVFFPTCAHLDEDGKTWNVPLHGTIYEPEANSTRRNSIVSGIGEVLQVEAGTPEAENLSRRVRFFLVDNEGGQTVFVRIGRKAYEGGTSGSNGHFQETVRLSAVEVEQLLAEQEAKREFLSFEAVTRKSDDRRFVGRVQLVGKTGLSIISDIDDTIKHSQVGDHEAVLANTFLYEFKPVPGMPELYHECAQKGVVFHYVSGSPWQLYLPLSDFLVAEGLPLGSFDLKHFRLKDPSTLADLLQSQEATKLPAIERVMTAFRERQFILIGDSGEQDPEIYAKVAREHGEQVVAIFIRNVTSEDIDGARFKAVRKGLDHVRFRLFKRPAEVRPVVEEISRLYGAEQGL
jgi:phosphatidate phosphatase APP1